MKLFDAREVVLHGFVSPPFEQGGYFEQFVFSDGEDVLPPKSFDMEFRPSSEERIPWCSARARVHVLN